MTEMRMLRRSFRSGSRCRCEPARPWSRSSESSSAGPQKPTNSGMYRRAAKCWRSVPAAPRQGAQQVTQDAIALCGSCLFRVSAFIASRRSQQRPACAADGSEPVGAHHGRLWLRTKARRRPGRVRCFVSLGRIPSSCAPILADPPRAQLLVCPYCGRHRLRGYLHARGGDPILSRDGISFGRRTPFEATRCRQYGGRRGERPRVTTNSITSSSSTTTSSRTTNSTTTNSSISTTTSIVLA